MNRFLNDFLTLLVKMLTLTLVYMVPVHMNLAKLIGRNSDRLTVAMLPRANAPGGPELVREQMSIVRRAQFSAIIATSEPMMIANIVNALALVITERHAGTLSVLTTLWAILVTVFASYGWHSARRFKAAPPRLSVGPRGPGKIVISSCVLALIWCYPLVVILPDAGLVQLAFISSLSAGMIAGGALALYPVALAGLVYTLIMAGAAFFVIVTNATIPSYSFGLVTITFTSVVVLSVHRHTSMFLSEIMGKLDAERQRDVVNLLLDTFQGEGGQVFWRADACLKLKTDPIPLIEILGLEGRGVTSNNLLDILTSADALEGNPALETQLTRLSSGTTHEWPEFEATLKTHRGLVLKLAGRPVSDESLVRTGYHGYVTDITSETRAKEKVLKLATRDPVTGLLNAAEFETRATEALSLMNRDREKALFLFIDADNLKTVNDSMGHAAGDALIASMARVLGQTFNAPDLAGRKGGDEFVVFSIMPKETDVSAWAATAARGLTGRFDHNGTPVSFTCSVGIAVAEGAAKSFETLELEADRALYHAKTQGRGLVQVYDDDMGSRVTGDRLLGAELAAALEAKELGFVLQPIVASGTGRVIGAEALVRWKHPVHGWVKPEKIAILAEEQRLGRDLLSLVLTQSLRYVRLWPANYFLSINISPHDLQQAGLPMLIADLLDQAGVLPSRIWLEITESALLQDSLEVRANLAALRILGLKIALDDFGAGYSSLSYISRYPTEIIKIDKSLVGQVTQNASNRVILNALVNLAELNGFDLVAEGVEDGQALTVLNEMGVGMAQGFGLHGPLKPEEFATLLEQEQAEITQVSELSEI